MGILNSQVRAFFLTSFDQFKRNRVLNKYSLISFEVRFGVGLD